MMFFLVVGCCIAVIDGKRHGTVQSQYDLGDICMPGTCASPNANCKRTTGNSFRCVCKDGYLARNDTHCLRVINASIDDGCASCMEMQGICLDEDADDRLDQCFCPPDQQRCQVDRTTTTTTTTTSSTPTTVSTEKMKIPSLAHALTMTLYNIDQKRWITRGDVIHMGDHLSIEIKYRLNDRRDVLVENCSIRSEAQRIPLLINGCSLRQSNASVHFRRLQPHHWKSSMFSIDAFRRKTIVQLFCSIRICANECEQPWCSSVQERKKKDDHLLNFYQVEELQQELIFQIPEFNGTSADDMFHKQKSFDRENTIEYSLVIAIMSILFIVVISVLSFLVYQQYSAGQKHSQLGDYDLRQRSDEYFIDPVVIQNIQSFSELKY